LVNSRFIGSSFNNDLLINIWFYIKKHATIAILYSKQVESSIWNNPFTGIHQPGNIVRYQTWFVAVYG
jgi:hypothetical protein